MGESSDKWNFKNPAVKRILRELKEIQQDNNPDIVAEALEGSDNESSSLFERKKMNSLVVLGFALLCSIYSSLSLSIGEKSRF